MANKALLYVIGLLCFLYATAIPLKLLVTLESIENFPSVIDKYTLGFVFIAVGGGVASIHYAEKKSRPKRDHRVQLDQASDDSTGLEKV